MNRPLHSRRLFLQRGMAILAATPTIPLFLDNTAHAIAGLDPTRTQDSGKDGKILVIVQLSGGNDGLNTIIPHGDDAYYRARPQIARQRDQILRIDDYLGMHPNLAPLKSLFDDARMTVVQGVGYPNPNRSHFRSMDIWHTADPQDERLASGWLGRYFDATCAGQDPHTAVSFGDQTPLAMKAQQFMSLCFEQADNFRYKGSMAGDYLKFNRPAHGETPPDAAAPAERDQIDFLARTALDAQASSDKILAAVKNHNPTQSYPGGGFGQSLRTVAAMIRGEMPTRVYYVQLGGFDTHANQPGQHDRLMQTFAQGISAFIDDLKQQKNDQRVLVMTFSEFGRRVAQNASQGTDHGAAAPLFLFGPRVRTGIVGNHPSLNDLDNGDLKFGVDFRSVYASILQQWLDAPSKLVLGRQWPTFDIVRG